MDASDTQAIRDELLRGCVTVDAFAEATGRTARAVRGYIGRGLPVRYVGNTAYVIVAEAPAWFMEMARKRLRPTPRAVAPTPKRGRPRKVPASGGAVARTAAMVMKEPE